MLRVKKEISTMVADEGKSQREIVLRQQMKTIKEELGEGGDDDEIEELREKHRLAQPPTRRRRSRRSSSRALPPCSSSRPSSTSRAPTSSGSPTAVAAKTTADKLDTADVRRCLDEDHFGLEKVKKRIVEYIAVRKLRADKKGPDPLLHRPARRRQDVARAIHRAVDGAALPPHRARRRARRGGGPRAPAHVRGRAPGAHHPGAEEGRHVKNPVLVLDEVDKLGVDVMGDPSAALLEVLDPAQNNTFVDHYLDVPFDLSQVTFLATANNADTIPAPLWDRLEVIEVPGYTRMEKRSIAREFLCPKQLSAHGLTDERLEDHDGLEASSTATRARRACETLEREIGAVCRSVAMRLAEGRTCTSRRTRRTSRRCSVRRATCRISPSARRIRAWRRASRGRRRGRRALHRGHKMPGKGNVVITGNLKSVMQESATTAVSFVRSKAKILGLDPEFLKTIDLHVHVPKGGTPKDGPSAGVTMFTAVASLLLVPREADVAMTGEITLRGSVLPVGGIKEKLLAAHRAGIKIVLMPARNERDLEDVPKDVLAELTIHLIKRVDEILPLALEPTGAPRETPSVPPRASGGASGAETKARASGA
jgi:ATP-dependent Lon protease